jgi:hypothetical protein
MAASFAEKTGRRCQDILPVDATLVHNPLERELQTFATQQTTSEKL